MGALDGKVAVVTGCAGERGVGRAIARRLAKEGADLMLTDVAPGGTRVVRAKPATEWGGLEAAAKEVREIGDGHDLMQFIHGGRPIAAPSPGARRAGLPG